MCKYNVQGGPRKWTEEEDGLLRAAVQVSGAKHWKVIASAIPGRDHSQCLQRWSKTLRPGIVKGRWSAKEDAKLRELVQRAGSDWGRIATEISGRTSKQCRQRWCFQLDPALKKTAFTPQEDETLLQQYQQIGSSWAKIALLIPGRTADSVKVRYKSLLRKRQREGDYATNNEYHHQQYQQKHQPHQQQQMQQRGEVKKSSFVGKAGVLDWQIQPRHTQKRKTMTISELLKDCEDDTFLNDIHRLLDTVSEYDTSPIVESLDMASKHDINFMIKQEELEEATQNRKWKQQLSAECRANLILAYALHFTGFSVETRDATLTAVVSNATTGSISALDSSTSVSKSAGAGSDTSKDKNALIFKLLDRCLLTARHPLVDSQCLEAWGLCILSFVQTKTAEEERIGMKIKMEMHKKVEAAKKQVAEKELSPTPEQQQQIQALKQAMQCKAYAKIQELDQQTKAALSNARNALSLSESMSKQQHDHKLEGYSRLALSLALCATVGATTEGVKGPEGSVVRGMVREAVNNAKICVDLVMPLTAPATATTTATAITTATLAHPDPNKPQTPYFDDAAVSAAATSPQSYMTAVGNNQSPTQSPILVPASSPNAAQSQSQSQSQSPPKGSGMLTGGKLWQWGEFALSRCYLAVGFKLLMPRNPHTSKLPAGELQKAQDCFNQALYHAKRSMEGLKVDAVAAPATATATSAVDKVDSSLQESCISLRQFAMVGLGKVKKMEALLKSSQSSHHHQSDDRSGDAKFLAFAAAAVDGGAITSAAAIVAEPNAAKTLQQQRQQRQSSNPQEQEAHVLDSRELEIVKHLECVDETSQAGDQIQLETEILTNAHRAMVDSSVCQDSIPLVSEQLHRIVSEMRTMQLSDQDNRRDSTTAARLLMKAGNPVQEDLEDVMSVLDRMDAEDDNFRFE